MFTSKTNDNQAFQRQSAQATLRNMSAANKALMHRWFEEVWNKKREAAIYEMLHPDALIYGLGDKPNEPVRGPEGFVPFWRQFTSAFPDAQISVESVLADEDQVAARCRVRGKHTGEGLGIKATDAQIDFSGMCIAQIRDGKLYEGWNNFDFLDFYKQLGLVKL